MANEYKPNLTLGRSLSSSLFRFLLAVERESRGEFARRHGARAKNLSPRSSRDSRLPERKRKRLLCRLPQTYKWGGGGGRKASATPSGFLLLCCFRF